MLDYSVLFRAQNPMQGLAQGINQGFQARDRREAMDAQQAYNQQLLELQKGQDARAAEAHQFQMDKNRAAIEAKQAEANRLAMVAQRQEEIRANIPSLFQLSSAVSNDNPRARDKMLDAALNEALNVGDQKLASEISFAKENYQNGNSRVGDDIIRRISREYTPDSHDQLFGTSRSKQVQLERDKVKLVSEMKDAADKESGLIPTEKRFQFEQDLRNQYLKEGGADLQKMSASLKNILTSDISGVGGLTTILSYMKMIDPTSVVSSTEKATAENSTGWTEKMRNLYNRALSDGQIGEKSINQFRSEAKRIFSNKKTTVEKEEKRIKRQANKYGLDVENIFGTKEDEAPFVEGQAQPQIEESQPEQESFSFRPLGQRKTSRGTRGISQITDQDNADFDAFLMGSP